MNELTDKTGMAHGSLRPIIYFENEAGLKLLAPYDKDKPEIARWVFEKHFKPLGFLWREASTWREWLKLQDDLVKQETREAESRRENFREVYEAGRKRTAAVLMQRRISSDCSAYERDFIDEWLKRAEAKRTALEKKLFEANRYLWAVEQDSQTKITDRIAPGPDGSK
jgi:hypothetical protein